MKKSLLVATLLPLMTPITPSLRTSNTTSTLPLPSKKIIFNLLPLETTQNAPQPLVFVEASKIPPLAFCEKKDQAPVLILTSATTGLKKYPIKSPLINKDLALTLPENEDQWPLFFHTLIEREVRFFFEKKQDGLILLALYQGLQEINQSKWSQAIQNSVREKMHICSEVPIPYEWKNYLVHFHDKTIAIASELAGHCFQRFEDLCLEKAKKNEKNILAQEALQGNLIEGKSVIFVADQNLPQVSPTIKVSQVCCFGLHSLLFAPLSLLMKAEKCLQLQEGLDELRFSLIHRYARAGKILTLNNPTNDSFLILNETPIFKPHCLFDDHFLKGPLANVQDQSFFNFWNLHFSNGINQITNNQILKNLFISDIKKIKEEDIATLNSKLVIWNNKIWMAKKNAKFKALHASSLSKIDFDHYFKRKLDFVQINPATASKILFSWLLKCCGITKNSLNKIIIGEKTLWPPASTTPSLDELNGLFNHLAVQKKTFLVPIGYSPTKKTMDELRSFRRYEAPCRQPLLHLVYPLFVFRDVLLADRRLSHSLKSLVERSCQKMVASFHNFLDVHDNLFGYVYGAELKKAVFQDCSELNAVQIQEITSCFLQFRDNPQHFAQLLRFFEEGVISRLTVLERNHLLAELRKPELFGILASNHLRKFFECSTIKGSKYFLATLLERSASVYELFFLTACLSHQDVFTHLKNQIEKGQDRVFHAAVKNALFYIQNEINLKNEFIDALPEDLKDNSHADHLINFFVQLFNKKEGLTLREFTPGKYVDQIKKSNSLIINNLQKQVQKCDFKDFLTVALKNSVYRLNRAKSPSHKILFDIAPFKFEGEPSLSLTVSDGAGFTTMDEIFNFLKNEGALLCQASSRLSIQTRLANNKIVYILVIPFREKGVVRHLNIKSIEIENKSFQGNVISALFYDVETSVDRVKIQCIRAEEFTNNVLGLARLNPWQIVLNNEEMPIKFDIKRSSVTFGKTTFIKMKEGFNEDQGYVLVDGFPFKPLHQFLVENGFLAPALSEVYSKGWLVIVDMSRPAPQMAQDFTDWFFHLSFSRAQLQKNFHQFESLIGDFDQIRPRSKKISPDELTEKIRQNNDPSTLKDFFNYYNFQGKSFITLLEDCYSTLIVELKKKKAAYEKFQLRNEWGLKNECKRLISRWKVNKINESTALTSEFLLTVIFPWLEKKMNNFYSFTPASSPLETPSTQSSSSKSDFLIPFTKEALELYARLYKKYVGCEKITIHFVVEEKGHLAWYCQTQKSITFNLALVYLHEILTELNAISLRQPIVELASTYPLFLSRGRESGLFNHELEHARRDPDPSHDQALDSEGQLVNFESSSAAYARLAHQGGMLDEFAEELDKLMSKYEGIKGLADLISTMKALKTNDYLLHVKSLLKGN